jgi:hypothetical protein
MVETRYQNPLAAERPVIQRDGVRTDVSSGDVDGANVRTDVISGDVSGALITSRPNRSLEHRPPSADRGFFYVLSGELTIAGRRVGHPPPGRPPISLSCRLIDADGAVEVVAVTGKASIRRILRESRRKAVLPIVVPVPTARAVGKVRARRSRGQRGQRETCHNQPCAGESDPDVLHFSLSFHVLTRLPRVSPYSTANSCMPATDPCTGWHQFSRCDRERVRGTMSCDFLAKNVVSPPNTDDSSGGHHNGRLSRWQVCPFAGGGNDTLSSAPHAGNQRRSSKSHA